MAIYSFVFGAGLSSFGANSWELYVDGASRGNPGPAGAGVFISKNGEAFLKRGFFLGSRTNNQAEYLALLSGLFFLEKFVPKGEQVCIFSDSELVVKQIDGKYRVKDAVLRDYFRSAKSFLTDRGILLSHILRGKNSIADELANKAIDQKRVMLSKDFHDFFERHKCHYR